MPAKSSSTKRTRSPSKAKKPTPKKKIVKVAAQEWDVYWVRTINGEEYVAEATIFDDGILMTDPTMLTYLHGSLVLAPYGIMAEEVDGVRPFFIQASAILHVNEASEIVRNLYEVSLETSLEYVENHFEMLVEKSLKTLVGAIAESMREPTTAELEELEKLMKDSNWDNPVPQTRSKSQTIDDLVKLADAKGKGKKTVG